MHGAAMLKVLLILEGVIAHGMERIKPNMTDS